MKLVVGVLLVLVLVSGCSRIYELNLEVARMSGLECRADKLVEGRCVRAQ